MKKILFILVLVFTFTGINAGINYIKEQHAMYELQQINMQQVEACTMYLTAHPDGVCD